MNWKTNLIILSVVVIASAVFTVFGDTIRMPVWESKIAQNYNDKSGKAKTPDVTFTDLQGQSSRLKDHKGKMVVVNFWASWCAPCVAEFPYVGSLADKHSDDIELIFVSNDFKRENIDKFRTNLDAEIVKTMDSADNITMVWDEDLSITNKIFGTYNLPETYVINPKGQMCRKIVGIIDFSEEYIAEIFEECGQEL